MSRRRLTYLLATSMLVCPGLDAVAQTAASQPAGKAPHAVHGTAARRAPAAARSVAYHGDSQGESVGVVGHGSTRQEQTLTTAQLMSRMVPGTTPLKALGTLPGVSFNSSDPLGVDLWSQSFYVRGFSALGFTLDGIPLGSQGYGGLGANINTAISNLNIAKVTVSQGAGAVDVPAANNLGGVMQFYSIDPSDRRGGTLSQTFGSNQAYQTFVRLNSGVLNPSGTKFFVSYSRTDENKWKGYGSQFLQQVNFKLVQPIGQSTKMTAFFDWDQSEADTYGDLSKNIINTLGYRVDYYKPDYAAAYRTALFAHGLPGGSLPPGYAGLDDPIDASVYDGPATGHDYLGGIKFDSQLTDKLRWQTMLYAHGKSWNAFWTNPWVTSPNGAPLVEQNEGSRQVRAGLDTGLTYHIAHHMVNLGVWYENSQPQDFYKFYQEPILGQGTPVDPVNALPPAFAEQWRYGYRYDLVQTHLQDTYRVTRNLTINAGFRSILYTGTNHIIENDPAYTGMATLPAGSISNNAAFLPQFSINYRFLPHHEVFFDFAENMSVMTGSGYNQGSPWGGPTQAAFDYTKTHLKPETAYVYELGYRYTSPWAVGLLALYHTDYLHRQGSVNLGSIYNSVSVLENVGSVNMNGVDASLNLMPIRGLSIYNSISYNSSRYANNLNTGDVVYDIKGKQAVNYPELMYKGSLSYTYRGAFAHIDTMMMGRRYLSYTNDVSVPHYWLTNLGAGYHFGDYSVLKNVTASFNVYNLTNIKYIANMGELGNSFSGDDQSMQAGAPRQLYGTISTNF